MTIAIGQYNTLNVTRVVDFGLYLDGGDLDNGGWGEILLPARYVPADCQVGSAIRVFIYFDSEDRIIATTETPKASVGQFAYLRVVDVNAAGAFLDWGLSKDLLVPYTQQANKMRQGAYYLVRVYQDEESERVTASAKLNRFLNQTAPTYPVKKSVNAIVMARTDLGYKVIIENQHTGMLYHNEIFQPLTIGQSITVRIKKIREDNKIDVLIDSPTKHDLSDVEQQILAKLAANNGILRMGDKTAPDVIYAAFSVSKKNFKRAVSRLYKQRLIHVEAECITTPQKEVPENY